MLRAPLIALLTDFGTLDPFVGIMKGVIAGLAPGVSMIDLTHELPPGDIRRGAVTLWQARPYFPPGTVFLAVVDPGVGTARRPVLVRAGDYLFVGPDNGLFTFVVERGFQAHELRNPQLALPNPRSTFHGRDLFAPAAAHAAAGVPAASFGPAVDALVTLPAPRLERLGPGILRGEVLFADRFGNLATSLGSWSPDDHGTLRLRPWLASTGAGSHPSLLSEEITLRVAGTRLKLADGRSLAWAHTFAELPPGQCGFLVGSSGLLEIVANQASAAELLGLRPGDIITLQEN